MRNISLWLSVVLFALLLAGCASPKPAASNTDPRVEAPVQSGSDVEIHGQISTSVGGTIK